MLTIQKISTVVSTHFLFRLSIQILRDMNATTLKPNAWPLKLNCAGAFSYQLVEYMPFTIMKPSNLYGTVVLFQILRMFGKRCNLMSVLRNAIVCCKFCILLHAALSRLTVCEFLTSFQLQNAQKTIEVRRRYNGMLDCFLRIPREQGFLSFWRGNSVNIARSCSQVRVIAIFY